MILSLSMPRWSDVLVEISKRAEIHRYCEKLNKGVKGSLSHLREIVKLLEKYDLIEIAPTRKIKKIMLTERGKRVSISILNIKSELSCI